MSGEQPAWSWLDVVHIVGTAATPIVPETRIGGGLLFSGMATIQQHGHIRGTNETHHDNANRFLALQSDRVAVFCSAAAASCAELVARAAELGEEGDVDGALAATKQADGLSKQHDALYKQLTEPERTMTVCDICGVFINSTDNEQRRLVSAVLLPGGAGDLGGRAVCVGLLSEAVDSRCLLLRGASHCAQGALLRGPGSCGQSQVPPCGEG